MKRILIDTDVLLDFFFDRLPYSDFAAVLLSMCDRKQIQGFVTPVICSNLYYLLRRNSDHETVIENIMRLLSIIEVLPMDRKIVDYALHSDFKDFEDALQNYSAVSDGTIEVIVTRNVKDFRHSKLAIMTPEDFIPTTGKHII